MKLTLLLLLACACAPLDQRDAIPANARLRYNPPMVMHALEMCPNHPDIPILWLPWMSSSWFSDFQWRRLVRHRNMENL